MQIPAILHVIIICKKILLYSYHLLLFLLLPDTRFLILKELIYNHFHQHEANPQHTFLYILLVKDFQKSIVFFLVTEVQLNIAWCVLLGLVGAVLGQLGDLSFSAIKRECGVKDYGRLLPGHGGVLDRFDSVIFASPVVWLLIESITLY